MDQATSQRAAAIFDRLRTRYPRIASALDWQDPWQLLTATVLAAQCTDARVNMVTPELFRRWPGPAELARAETAELEGVIHATGFFRNKAKNLKGAAQAVVERHQGRTPQTMAELTALPGVARKTANIVLSNAFGIHEGVAVDTHVKRLAARMGLTRATRPEAIEKDLMALFPRPDWGEVNHLLVFFGREMCTARKPRCERCPLADICPREGVA